MKPERRTAGKAFGAGAVALVILVGILALTFTAVNGNPFESRKIIRAEFNNVHSLAVNDDVRENSIRVGRVTRVQIRDGKALVTMALDGNPPVYRDVVARIWDVSALAAKFVELEPGTPGAGPLGDEVIPASRNEDSHDIWEILNVFDPKTRVQMSSFLREFGGGLLGHGSELNAFLHSGPPLLRNVGTVSESLASPQFDLPRLISTNDRLDTRFRGREAQISELLRHTDETFKAITVANSGPLKNVLAKAPGTLRAMRPALDSMVPTLADARVAMTDLRSGARGLGQGTPELRGFMRDSVPVSHKVPDFTDEARSPVGDLSDTVDDARPLVNRAVDTFDFLARPLHVLAPYGPEMGSWFTRMHSFVGQGAEPGKRYAHLGVVMGAQTVTGGVLHSDPKRYIDPYPKPGQAEHEWLKSGLPAGIGLGGSKR
jgi:phospholipid/cholesterol/gamma-HCH transport system substrate-binding protein